MILIVKAYSEERLGFDEIHIQNLGLKSRRLPSQKIRQGTYEYEVIRPKRYEGIRVIHKQREGWMELTRKVLNKIRKREIWMERAGMR